MLKIKHSQYTFFLWQILWCVELTPAGISVEKTAQFTLPTSKQRWVSCADMIPDSCLLVCGDRVGSIHVFDMQQQVRILNGE